jgi:hypothetical protein
MEEATRRLTYDEILHGMEEIARDPDDRDRFKALKALAASQSASVVLPEPLTYEERKMRLSRIMKAYGADLCRTCFSEAFPKHRDALGDIPPTIIPDDLTEGEERECLRVKSLPLIYKKWPALKRSGVLPGFPRGRGGKVQTEWCQNYARKIIRDQKQSAADAATFIDSLKDDHEESA